MKKACILIIIVLFAVLLFGCLQQETESSTSVTSVYDTTMKRDLLCLMMSYPDYIENVEKDANGLIYLKMRSGRRIIYDDGRKKSFDEKLSNADLQDMMEQVYPLWNIDTIMPQGFDPGRLRVYGLLKEVYGSSKEQIMKNLTNVNIGGKNFSFNKNNNASKSMRQAFNEILAIAQQRNSIYGFVYPVNGTFNYRIIAGTNQLSPHSFGIAVDLKSDKRDYWRWATKEQGQKRLDSYPMDVVRAFENNDFIWGGKWGHFDILHFEYRPELITKARYHVEEHEAIEPWYYGFPEDDAQVKKFIKMIDTL